MLETSFFVIMKANTTAIDGALYWNIFPNNKAFNQFCLPFDIIIKTEQPIASHLYSNVFSVSFPLSLWTSSIYAIN